MQYFHPTTFERIAVYGEKGTAAKSKPLLKDLTNPETVVGLQNDVKALLDVLIDAHGDILSALENVSRAVKSVGGFRKISGGITAAQKKIDIKRLESMKHEGRFNHTPGKGEEFDTALELCDVFKSLAAEDVTLRNDLEDRAYAVADWADANHADQSTEIGGALLKVFATFHLPQLNKLPEIARNAGVAAQGAASNRAQENAPAI